MCGMISKLRPLATLTGLEPVTSGVTGQLSNHLNYRAMYMPYSS